MAGKHKEPFRLLYVIICLMCFATGMLVILYPCISSAWNSHTQSRAINGYNETIHEAQQHTYDSIWEKVQMFNESVIMENNAATLSDRQMEEYLNLLCMDQDGMMGYLEIPAINCRLPIYHGTEEKKLNSGAGHIEWSSLPSGGTGNHCVICGHSGLPQAVLFNHLSDLQISDRFVLHVLDRIMVYEIYRIETCLPEETDLLKITEGQDLCTLVTCTPYGINSHRLLVMGKRVEEPLVSVQEVRDEKRDHTFVGAVIISIWMCLWLCFLNIQHIKNIMHDTKG